ncbi:hypothetical protein K470DRAFT_194295, partial [Piedraia hortae CBS 480.64]
ANLIPGGTQHTAGGSASPPEVNWTNAFPGGIKWKDFADLPRRPCMRESWLQGIGWGFALGGLRAIWRGSVWTSCCWASGGFIGISSLSYVYCKYRRNREKEGMMRAVEVLNRNEQGVNRKREKVREERRAEKEKELDRKFAEVREKS